MRSFQGDSGHAAGREGEADLAAFAGYALQGPQGDGGGVEVVVGVHGPGEQAAFGFGGGEAGKLDISGRVAGEVGQRHRGRAVLLTGGGGDLGQDVFAQAHGFGLHEAVDLAGVLVSLVEIEHV